MATNLKDKKPIDPEQHKVMLQNLQGNILKGHGREYSRCIFLQLNEKEPVKELCNQLAKIAAKVVTSAWQQHIESQNYKKYKTPSSTFGNLFLTAKGYEKLGVSRDELKEKLLGSEKYFLQGMKNVYKDLQDPDPAAERTTWEDGYKDGRIDAMILLADKDEEFLERAAGQLMTELRKFSEILAYERGNVLQKGDKSVEHFGHADGLSQPVFLDTDNDRPKKEEDRNKWDPFASLELVLVEDTLAKREDCFGSYLVFRKLEQDVIGFEHGKRNLPEQLGLKESEHEKVGAMMIGRFEEGTPLVQSDKALVSRAGGESPDNNFTYNDDDPNEPRCPVFAHIRVTNPRTSREREHRIVRRGIPYGKRDSWDQLPTEPVGLLFMCFQANIGTQFVHIQQRANQAHDPIIGQEDPNLPDPPYRELPAHLARRAMLTQIIKEAPDLPNPPDRVTASVKAILTQIKEEPNLPTLLDQESREDLAHRAIRAVATLKKPSFDASWVKLKGGEFFFAPSIPFLTGPKTKS